MGQINRRSALAAMGAALAAPFAFRHFATAAPSETLLHASFGAGGMAWADIGRAVVKAAASTNAVETRIWRGRSSCMAGPIVEGVRSHCSRL